jgi:hypothetical protein
MRMQIVVDFGLDLQGYCQHFDELVIAQRDCPICQTAGSLVGNGSYPRHPLDTTQRYELWVKRRYCKACHGTISFLPSFLLCFRWYLLIVIQSVVVAHFEQEWSWRQVTAQCTIAGAPAARTIRRWCRSFATQAPAWLVAVQATLAEQDPAAPLLDPLGSAAGPVQPARALLAAVWHLLAWAKTRWTELARHGPGDRLRFLWHWGHGRGLVRLV